MPLLEGSTITTRRLCLMQTPNALLPTPHHYYYYQQQQEQPPFQDDSTISTTNLLVNLMIQPPPFPEIQLSIYTLWTAWIYMSCINWCTNVVAKNVLLHTEYF